MAATYRAPEVVERERRLAAELVQREGLVPPVAVRQLVEQRATITIESIPAGCDAVVIGIQGTTPEVILQPTANRRRERFTLGHELGHLVIPWHLGTLSCHVDATDVVGDYLHSMSESEANRFAADLLVPQAWLRSLFNDSDQLPEVFERLSEAEVSAHVACLQLVRTLATGWLFAIVDDDDRVILSGRSADTDVPSPRKLEPIPASFDRFCDEAHHLRHGSRTVHWWHAGAEVVAEMPVDERTSTEVLRELTRRHTSTDAAAQRLFMRINGVTGYAYGRVAAEEPTAAELLGRLRPRFAGRKLPDELLEDEDLDRYLLRRALELQAKRPRQ